MHKVTFCLHSCVWCVSPLFELGVEDTVGEALSADPDALQHAVAAQLVQHQEWIHDS